MLKQIRKKNAHPECARPRTMRSEARAGPFNAAIKNNMQIQVRISEFCVLFVLSNNQTSPYFIGKFVFDSLQIKHSNAKRGKTR